MTSPTLAKVDASLVSRVINDDPKAGASPNTRQRIIDAVRQLDYRPNVVARGLRMARTWTMGVLVPSVTNPMYADVIAGAEERAQELGYGIVFRTHVEGAREEIFTRLLQQGRVDGLIVASGLLRDAFIRRIAVGRLRPRGPRQPAGQSGREPASLSTTRPGPPLLSATCSTTATFTSSACSARRRSTPRDGGAPVTPGRCARPVSKRSPWTCPGGTSATATTGFFGSSMLIPNTTAVFVSTMVMAVGAIRGLRERGLSVPDDVSLVALHDSDLAEFLNPPLTTVSLPIHEMGSAAVDLLVDLIDGGAPRSIVVDGAPVLIERQSVRALTGTTSDHVSNV